MVSGNLLGIPDGGVQHVAKNRGPHGNQGRKEESQGGIQRNVWENRFQRRARGVGDTNVAVLEAGIDTRFLDLPHQLLIQFLVAFGPPLQGLILEGACVQTVEFRFGLGHGAREHTLPG